MKQVFQNLKSGETLVLDVPRPFVDAGSIGIANNASFISSGTERMLVDFGKASLVGKALQQPERVKEVVQKLKADGLTSVLEAVRAKLNEPIPLGYSCVGEVKESADPKFPIGQRVVSNGPHAEYVVCSKNLCAAVPDNVSDETAAFSVVASVSLQGVRLLEPTVGETFVVIGLGVLGLLAVQILKASGCKVIGVDFNRARCTLAQNFGAQVIDLTKADDPLIEVESLTSGRGADGALICAATDSDAPLEQAAKMCRQKGRIVLVGVVGSKFSRADFYEKELKFQVSCSYGPGRYDKQYEDDGMDYPIGHVRWTAQRNFEAVLQLMSDGAIHVDTLISNRFSIDEAVIAYDTLISNKDCLGIVLNYPKRKNSMDQRIQLQADSEFLKSEPVVAFFGSGNYASRTLIPAFKSAGAQLNTIVSKRGFSAAYHGAKHNFIWASTEIDAALDDERINTVVISTRHNLHCEHVEKSLNARKNIFVEKPLAICLDEVARIRQIYESLDTKPRLMMGFNRRFSPHIKVVKKLLETTLSPKVFIMTMNAGAVPKDHWTQNIEEGGGRIIGEACHYVDLMCYLAGSPVADCDAVGLRHLPSLGSRGASVPDTATLKISFKDGSFGTINYLANGGKIFPKERIEIFVNGAALQIDNFKKTRGFGWPKFRKFTTFTQDKGQLDCVRAFVNSIKNGESSPIPINDILNVSVITIEMSELLRT